MKPRLKIYFNFYDSERFHQSLEYLIHDKIYYNAFSNESEKNSLKKEDIHQIFLK